MPLQPNIFASHSSNIILTFLSFIVFHHPSVPSHFFWVPAFLLSVSVCNLYCKQLSCLALLNSLQNCASMYIDTNTHAAKHISLMFQIQGCISATYTLWLVLTYLHPAGPTPLKPQHQHQWFIGQCFRKMHTPFCQYGAGEEGKRKHMECYRPRRRQESKGKDKAGMMDKRDGERKILQKNQPSDLKKIKNWKILKKRKMNKTKVEL